MIEFGSYQYYPALRSRMWELRGYSELANEDKDSLLPLISVAKFQSTKNVTGVTDIIAKTMNGRPIVVYLETSEYYRCVGAEEFLDPSNEFKN